MIKVEYRTRDGRSSEALTETGLEAYSLYKALSESKLIQRVSVIDPDYTDPIMEYYRNAAD